jgi:hypothetical protein
MADHVLHTQHSDPPTEFRHDVDVDTTHWIDAHELETDPGASTSATHAGQSEVV